MLDYRSAAIFIPVTGEVYTKYARDPVALMTLRSDRSYDVTGSVRDPRYLDPTDNNLPAYDNPANYIEQRHLMVGVSIRF